MPIPKSIPPTLAPSWRDQKVAILGFGREGQAMAKYALARGAEVTICDITENIKETPSGRQWAGKKVTWKLGTNYLKELDQFAVIVRSPGIPVTTPELVQAQRRGALIWSLTKEFFAICPAPIIGVTGTKGKGTTASLITEMIKLGKKRVHLVGNIGLPAIDLLPQIKKQDWVVYELSSFQLQDLTTSPAIAVLLGLTADHLDHHKNLREYYTAKANIVRHQTAKDVAIFSIDYPSTLSLVDQTKAQLLFVSRRLTLNQGVYVAGDLIVRRLGKKLEKVVATSEVALKGRFNLENVIAATAAASLVGVNLAAIRQAIRNYAGQPHRLEYVATIDGIEYWNNSAGTTPETTIAALSAFTQPVVLLVGGSPKGHNYNQLGSSILKSTTKVIVGIGATAATIYEAVKKSAHGRSSKLPAYVDGGQTMGDMIRAAQKFTKAGDVVLLAPGAASFDKFNSYAERGEQFKAAILSAPKKH